jgi:hypothetical protein
MGGYQYDFTVDSAPGKAALKARVASDFVNLVLQGKANAISTAVYMLFFESRRPVSSLRETWPTFFGVLDGIFRLQDPLPSGYLPLLKDYRMEFEMLMEALSYVISDVAPKKQQDVRPLALDFKDYVITELINESDKLVLGDVGTDTRSIENKVGATHTRFLYEPFNELLTTIGCGLGSADAFQGVVKNAIIAFFHRFGHSFGETASTPWGKAESGVVHELFTRIDGNLASTDTTSGLRRFIPLTADDNTYTSPPPV